MKRTPASAKPPGTPVGVVYRGAARLVPGDVLRSSTGRLYLVNEMVGNLARCVVLAEAQAGARVVAMEWI